MSIVFGKRMSYRYGPKKLLQQVFKTAEESLKARGVELRYATFKELNEINVAIHKANPESWRLLLPIFDPARAGFSEASGICLFGYDSRGEIVLTQAVRRMNWKNTDFHEEASSMRLFYKDPEEMRGPRESITVDASAAKHISGLISYTGAHWVRPDFRGRGLTAITPCIARALAIERWPKTDFFCTIMANNIFERGTTARARYAHHDWSVHLYHTPTGTFPAALLWMTQDEAINDLVVFLEQFQND